ncbi:hypothetical protein CYY_001950 [Polysphondylium violaceum]|uniref:Mitochondrial escape protein 2 n=1 Tax=Polysphondylium violaceum TaxID=133409 RepID=A0A8J4PZ99_9MYCE|nr:hypothetical protein CYY_001950 [Polysphondylium violaceum]
MISAYQKLIKPQSAIIPATSQLLPYYGLGKKRLGLQNNSNNINNNNNNKSQQNPIIPLHYKEPIAPGNNANVSHLSMNTIHTNNAIGNLNKRNINSWGFRFILGFSIIGIMFFARRWTPRQIKRIITKFKKGSDDVDILSLTAKEQRMYTNISFNRDREEESLNKFLQSPPLGPIVVVGPEGSGKSHIMKKILSSRSMSILVDMRQNAVMSGDELILSFLKKLGYLLPSSDPISSLLFKGDKKQKINVQEIVQGLETVYLSLIQIREVYNITPLIAISNIEALPTSENFTRFLDWCLSVTDNKLAHIVFLTSSQFVHFHLDANINFRKRRFVYNIKFPSNEEVINYLHLVFNESGDSNSSSTESSVNSHLNLLSTNNNTPFTSAKNNNIIISDSSSYFGKKCSLSKPEIEHMVSIFGGQMRDIDLISGLVKRGEDFHYVMDLFISETVQKIGSQIDSMFQKANIADNDTIKTNTYEKYQRFYKMLEILTDVHLIRVSELIQEVFHEQPEELDEYFQDNLIYFWVGATSHHSIPEITISATSSSNSTPIIDSSSNSNNDDIDDDETRGNVEKKLKGSAGSLSMISSNANNSASSANNGGLGNNGMNIRQYSFDNFVSFSSPRIQHAVQIVLKDNRFKLQRETIEKYFKKSDLKDDKKELEEEKVLKHNEYERITTRLDNLVANSKEWIKYIGEPEFLKRKDYLILKENELLLQMEKINSQLFKIENELDNL